MTEPDPDLDKLLRNANERWSAAGHALPKEPAPVEVPPAPQARKRVITRSSSRVGRGFPWLLFWIGVAAVAMVACLGSSTSNANDWSTEKCTIMRGAALMDGEEQDEAMAEYLVHCCGDSDDLATCRP